MLSDHFIGPLEHASRNSQVDLFRSFEINDEFKLRCLLYGQISWLGTSQNLVHVNSRAPIEVVEVYPVGHEPALIDKLLLKVNSGQPVFTGQLDDSLSLGEKGASALRHNRVDMLLLCGLKGVL